MINDIRRAFSFRYIMFLIIAFVKLKILNFLHMFIEETTFELWERPQIKSSTTGELSLNHAHLHTILQLSQLVHMSTTVDAVAGLDRLLNRDVSFSLAESAALLTFCDSLVLLATAWELSALPPPVYTILGMSSVRGDIKSQYTVYSLSYTHQGRIVGCQQRYRKLAYLAATAAANKNTTTTVLGEHNVFNS